MSNELDFHDESPVEDYFPYKIKLTRKDYDPEL